MARKKRESNKPVENSAAEVESAMLNEMDVIGAGDIPADVKENKE